ncbi:BspA family leucine-rich repeat surface protein [Winogradskyella sediminis]|uniref:BspA family leucine-rich repeat surface protein n=1 Tax=Winogradskyella sediminis TaxID=1382466 RepID=UPI003AA90A97
MKKILLLVLLTFMKVSLAQNEFVMTWEVAGTSSSAWSIEIPTTGTGYNYTVDFGDSSPPINNVSGNITHNYSAAGTYTVSITGDFPRIYFPNTSLNNRYKIKSIEQWGNIQWSSMESAFKDCYDLVVNALDSPDLSQVTDMSYMFYGIDSINQSINNWNVSNVNDMSYMFSEMGAITTSLSNWNVSNVTNMSHMFDGSEFYNQTLNINSWNVSNVTDMSYMFSFGTNSFNEPLNNWDVSSVVTMEGMFYYNQSFVQPLNNWNVSNVNDMSKMFYNTSFNQPLNNWDVSSVMNMESMFRNNHEFNQNINSWNVSSVINMEDMFNYCIAFNQPMNNWNVSNVTNMKRMFYNAHVFNQPMDNWNVSNVTDMSYMFNRSYAFNQSIDSWNVINVTTMQSMFQDANTFNQPMNNWNVVNVTSMRDMFNGASSFNQPLDLWNVSNSWNLYGMFDDASSFNQDLTNWDFNTQFIDLRNFLNGSNLDIQNYDNLLLTFANSGITNEEIGVLGLNYCNVDARNYLINQGWYFYFDTLSTACNIIFGSVYYDFDNNGCTNTDIEMSNLIVDSNNGNNSYSTFVINSSYNISVYGGNQTVSLINLPSYFTVTPQSQTIDFLTTSTEQVDFCLTANQAVEDLNITILPLDDARPGFDSNYKLIVQNVGTETLNAVTVNVLFDNSKQSFVSATPIATSTTANTLDFSIGTIQPFGSTEVEFVMQTLTPPTVNADDVLTFTATVLPDASDYTPNDNVFTLNQIVVNAYDPNDKRVLQGDEITMSQTADYLDYIIRFQNTGSANATFVRIEDNLDPELDWNTLKITSASHAYDVKITNGNEVEFLFDNINLPFEAADEPNSHGYIAYKIKPKTTVQIGDIMSGNASIYFDYNPPIITNTVSTEVIENLSTDEYSFQNALTIYPNPTNEYFKVEKSNNVNIESIKIYNISGKLVKEFTESERYNVSDLNSGFYFLRIKTDKSQTIKKLVKS